MRKHLLEVLTSVSLIQFVTQFTPSCEAGQIILPSNLDRLLVPGNFFAVAGDRFDIFTYDSQGEPPFASDINVLQFLAGGEHGFTLTSGFIVPTGKKDIDYRLTYTLNGTDLTDALLSGAFSGSGTASITEVLSSGSNVIGSLEITSKGLNSDSLVFGPITGQIAVQTDIALNGTGVSVSVVNEGFSPTASVVCEPESVVLLCVGLVLVLMFLRSGWCMARTG